MLLQVAILFPEEEHPRYGVVRAMVKDTSNEYNTSTAGQEVFLDSDGLVADNVAQPRPGVTGSVGDGQWHMVTLTTHSDLSTGFLMYLDGIKVGDMLQGNYTGELICLITKQ